jgi:copper homeostasis protein
MTSKKYIIEIATSDYSTTKSAVDGGADRIELCANLAEGGTTPSFGTVKQCREAFDVFVVPDHQTQGRRFFI